MKFNTKYIGFRIFPYSSYNPHKIMKSKDYIKLPEIKLPGEWNPNIYETNTIFY